MLYKLELFTASSFFQDFCNDQLFCLFALYVDFSSSFKGRDEESDMDTLANPGSQTSSKQHL